MASEDREAAGRAVILLSGGLDSYVAAGLAREAGFRLLALTIDYGQRHRAELDCASRIAASLGVERQIILPLDLSLFGGSALTDDIDVPKDGRACGESETIPVTYVPARNTILLSLCLGWAEAAGARHIFIGVNARDYSNYPDCRPEFIRAFEQVANLGTKDGVEGRKFQICAPLQQMTKAGIALEAARLGLDAGLSLSCYDPGPGLVHCGSCDSCRLRARGFAEAKLVDPTLYASPPDTAR